MASIRRAACVLSIMLLVIFTPVHVAASTGPSIPINGRYSVLTIKIYIPSDPKWAHDILLNATIAWNQAQLWYLQNNPLATAYTLVETDDGSATSIVSFSMPAAFASFAVGWTAYQYKVDVPSSIVSTQTYLTPTIFNDAQGGNSTARAYAFWLALHETGRILGLGSVLDGRDIMEPRYTAGRIDEVPKFSTLDLYALHVLAEGNAPNFVTLPAGIQNQFAPATAFLAHPHQLAMSPIPGIEQTTPQVTIPPAASVFRHFRFLTPFPV